VALAEGRAAVVLDSPLSLPHLLPHLLPVSESTP
jgi:hypothetical protein